VVLTGRVAAAVEAGAASPFEQLVAIEAMISTALIDVNRDVIRATFM
jgi:hypothetical protein